MCMSGGAPARLIAVNQEQDRARLGEHQLPFEEP